MEIILDYSSSITEHNCVVVRGVSSSFAFYYRVSPVSSIRFCCCMYVYLSVHTYVLEYHIPEEHPGLERSRSPTQLLSRPFAPSSDKEIQKIIMTVRFIYYNSIYLEQLSSTRAAVL